MIPNNVMQLLRRVIPNIDNIQGLQNINTPDDMAQFLLNSGKVNQAQVNQAMSMRNNPAIQMLMRGMK